MHSKKRSSVDAVDSGSSWVGSARLSDHAMPWPPPAIELQRTTSADYPTSINPSSQPVSLQPESSYDSQAPSIDSANFTSGYGVVGAGVPPPASLNLFLSMPEPESPVSQFSHPLVDTPTQNKSMGHLIDVGDDVDQELSVPREGPRLPRLGLSEMLQHDCVQDALVFPNSALDDVVELLKIAVGILGPLYCIYAAVFVAMSEYQLLHRWRLALYLLLAATIPSYTLLCCTACECFLRRELCQALLRYRILVVQEDSRLRFRLGLYWICLTGTALLFGSMALPNSRLGLWVVLLQSGLTWTTALLSLYRADSASPSLAKLLHALEDTGTDSLSASVTFLASCRRVPEAVLRKYCLFLGFKGRALAQAHPDVHFKPSELLLIHSMLSNRQINTNAINNCLEEVKTFNQYMSQNKLDWSLPVLSAFAAYLQAKRKHIRIMLRNWYGLCLFLTLKPQLWPDDWTACKRIRVQCATALVMGTLSYAVVVIFIFSRNPLRG